LHDVLVAAAFLTIEDSRDLPEDLFEALVASKRAARVALSETSLWIAADRLPELQALHASTPPTPALAVPPSRLARRWTREEALVEFLRGRMTVVGPTTAADLAASLAIDERDAGAALMALEAEGVVLRGRFSGIGELEWCDRGLLARIHRYTLNRLRAEIEPLSAADFQRFLFVWHGITGSHRLTGIDGLRAILATLDGVELPASAWERTVLPMRLNRYDPSWLDFLCLTGEIGWARLSCPVGPAGTERGALRVALFPRDHARAWRSLRLGHRATPANVEPSADGTRRVLATLRSRGPSFFGELVAAVAADDGLVDRALAELAVAGLAVSDGFAGVRGVARTLRRQPPRARRQDAAGRWSAVPLETSVSDQGLAVETQARVLLSRYGVVFRRLLAREVNAAPWRSLTEVYRRLEARGEIRGGRFVTGMSGEQFALPDAVERLREVRRSGRDGRVTAISAVDPLNLTGILTAGERIRATVSGRLAYRDGVAVAVLEGDYLRPLGELDAVAADGVASALTGRPVPAVASGFVGR
jgi:ATP-dependent Lhr-like helicase